jgi:parallel beta-helix repeat protein
VGGARDVTVQGLIIEGYQNPAQQGVIHTVGQRWLIADNEVRDNAGGGIAAGPGFRVIGNYVHHNDQIGIIGQGADILIEGNEIAFNNYRDRYDPNWEAGGSKFVATSGLVLRDNYVHDNHGPGLWTDINNVGTLYEGNTAVNNHGPGIFHEISYQAVIRNNHVEGNGFQFLGCGIAVSNSPGVEVHGNTVRNNEGGICGFNGDRGTGTFGPYELRDLRVHDNTVSYTSGFSGVNATSGGSDPYTSWGNRFDANRYSVGGVTHPFRWGGASLTPQQWVTTGNDTTATWS